MEAFIKAAESEDAYLTANSSTRFKREAIRAKNFSNKTTW